VRQRRARTRKPDARHRRLEFFPVLGLVDRFLAGADHLNAVLLEHAFTRQIQCTIQRGLSAHRRQYRVRPFHRDDLFDHLPGDGFDIRCVRHLRISHDRCRIRVDQDDAISFLS
jgi:hypothetical protein